MSEVERFLTAQEEADIIVAIRQAEQNTSGEIRVHIEKSSSIAHYDRAVEVFQLLKMYNTKQRNGVLIYIAVEDHQFVIYGDEGIHNIVSNTFWNTTRDVMQRQFKNQNYKQGIIDGILRVGEQLKGHFPWQINDVDELPNTISKG